METITLSFPVDVDHAELASGAPRRFRGVAYSGGLVPGYGFLGDVAIDLDGIDLPGQAFALVNHDPNKIAGKVAPALSGQAIVVEGTLFGSTDAGREVSALFGEEAPWQLSVGINARTEVFDKPTKVQVNGQELTLHAVFRDCSFREVSFVPVGADPHTSAAAFSATRGKAPMPDTTPDEVAEIREQLDVAAARIAELEAALEAATSKIAQAETAARMTAVRSLYTELGRDLDDESAAKFAAIPVDLWDVVAAQLRALKPAADAALFHEQATGSTGNQAADPDSAIQDRWNKSPGLRAEFGDFETFAAFARADSRGMVQILKGGNEA